MLIDGIRDLAEPYGAAGTVVEALVAVVCIVFALALARDAIRAFWSVLAALPGSFSRLLSSGGSAILLFGIGLIFGQLALATVQGAISTEWLTAYVFVLLLGGCVGAAELVSRYKDRPARAVTTIPALFYISLNALGSIAALYLVHIYPKKIGLPENTGAWTSGDLVQAVLVAGFSSLLFFRTSLFKLRVGDTDLAVGPAIVLDALLAAADRAVDRVMAAPRAEFVHHVMAAVSFEKAAVILPAHCLALMQNVSNPETQRIVGVVDSLRANKDMPDKIKSLNLGLALLTVVGEEVLETAVNGLRDDLQDSTAQLLQDVANVMEPVSFERAAHMVPPYCYALWPKPIPQEEQDKLAARAAALQSLQDVPAGYKALLLGIWLARITDGATLRKAVVDLGASIRTATVAPSSAVPTAAPSSPAPPAATTMPGSPVASAPIAASSPPVPSTTAAASSQPTPPTATATPASPASPTPAAASSPPTPPTATAASGSPAPPTPTAASSPPAPPTATAASGSPTPTTTSSSPAPPTETAAPIAPPPAPADSPAPGLQPRPVLGILAYGSLIDCPGPEISDATESVLVTGITTPFAVEYARGSRIRGGAPTLVPVAAGGARVPARIIVLKSTLSEEEARNRLWRREIGAAGSDRQYVPADRPGPDDVIIKTLEDFGGVERVLYTEIAPNIDPLDAVVLARLARESLEAVGKGDIEAGRDGVSYLMNALANGAMTPWSGPYEEEIKRQAQAQTLEEALEKPVNQWLQSR